MKSSASTLSLACVFVLAAFVSGAPGPRLDAQQANSSQPAVSVTPTTTARQTTASPTTDVSITPTSSIPGGTSTILPQSSSGTGSLTSTSGTITGTVVNTSTGVGTETSANATSTSATNITATSVAFATPFTPRLTSVAATYTQSFAPNPTQSAANTTVEPNDPHIATEGPDWQTSQSSCDSAQPSKKNSSPGQYLNYTFAGTAIYMSTAQSRLSSPYSVVLDGKPPVEVDNSASDQTPQCGVSWSAFNLENTIHNIIVTVLGPSSNAAPDSQNGASQFEFDGFV